MNSILPPIQEITKSDKKPPTYKIGSLSIQNKYGPPDFSNQNQNSARRNNNQGSLPPIRPYANNNPPSSLVNPIMKY